MDILINVSVFCEDTEKVKVFWATDLERHEAELKAN